MESKQLDFFDNCFKHKVNKLSKNYKKAYYGTPGKGPENETCKSCIHYCRVDNGGSRAYLKCGLNNANWTHGKGTDIKANTPACEHWDGYLEIPQVIREYGQRKIRRVKNG